MHTHQWRGNDDIITATFCKESVSDNVFILQYLTIMKAVKDIFSTQSSSYKKYRPTYPSILYDDFLAHVDKKNECWDCGTGNGQVAVELSKHFNQVQASDISERQIKNATKKENITYSITRAEKTHFADNQFDLVAVGQAAHWFDFDAFNQEVKRVTKPGGVIAIWGYGLLKINAEVDSLIDRFYTEIIGPYWDKERRHIDNSYQSIKFDFEEVPYSKQRTIDVNWGLAQLQGYFNSWSCVQHYKKQNNGKNPVDELIEKISICWKSGIKKDVKFPIFMRLGRI